MADKRPEQDTSPVDRTKDPLAAGIDDPAEARRKGLESGADADPPGERKKGTTAGQGTPDEP